MPVETSATGDTCGSLEMLSGGSTFRACRIAVRRMLFFGFTDETVRIVRVLDLLIRFAILLADYFYALPFRTIFK